MMHLNHVTCPVPQGKQGTYLEVISISTGFEFFRELWIMASRNLIKTCYDGHHGLSMPSAMWARAKTYLQKD